MFFKKITIFRIKNDIDIDDLKNNLNKLAFKAIDGFTKSSRGFIHPLLEHNEDCHHCINSLLIFCLKKEEKLLPSSVINDEFQKRLSELEEQGHSISKSQKTEIKEQIEQQLLPQAFSKYKRLFGYFDFVNKLLIIESISDKQIDECLELLKKCTDFLEIEPVLKEETKELTKWFIDRSTPVDIELGEKCKLTSDIGDGIATITCQGRSMLTDQIKAFVESGGDITEIAITWDECLSMTITSKLQFKSIKFIDDIKDTDSSLNGVYKQEADILLMADTFAELVNSIENWNLNPSESI